MKNHLDSRKATHSQVNDPEFHCIYQTQIPTFSSFIRFINSRYMESQISRDWNPNQSMSFITYIFSFYFLIIISGFCFFPWGYPEKSPTSQNILHTRFSWEIIRTCKYNITRGGCDSKIMTKRTETNYLDAKSSKKYVV